jgi:hypothetical protein
MNVKSKFDTSDEPKEPKKKYLWLGYGNTNQGGRDTRGSMSAVVWDPHTFDVIFEKLGLKKKKRKRSEGEE